MSLSMTIPLQFTERRLRSLILLEKGHSRQKGKMPVRFSGHVHSYRQKEDRIIFCSDGVSQSGMGSEAFPFGWGRDEIALYAASLVHSEAFHIGGMLSGKIVTMAHKNDTYKAHDDISCATIYFRDPAQIAYLHRPSI